MDEGSSLNRLWSGVRYSPGEGGNALHRVEKTAAGNGIRGRLSSEGQHGEIHAPRRRSSNTKRLNPEMRFCPVVIRYN